MENTDIARKLILGSEAIDRMRREIDLVVKMVLGFIEKEDRRSVVWGMNDPKKHEFISPTHMWIIERALTTAGETFRGERWETFVECRLLSTVGGGPSEAYAYSTSHGVSDIPLRQVKAVHDGLSVFVEGMVEKFPFLAERSQPLIEAAS